jgi:superfamily I DNA/RNA helicase
MPAMRDCLSGLNPEQKEAVLQIEGPLLVLAGAGTGKTRVITSRIAYMIEQGIPPEQIAGMTFTNKAAAEMRERVAAMVPGSSADKVTLGTFHSFCARILRRDIAYAGNYNSNYSILDESDQTGIIKQASAELGFGKDEIPAKEVAAFIGRCKNQMQFPSDVPSGGNDAFLAIYERYQQILELQNALDFDDLLLLVLKVFREQPECLARYQDRYRYLLVDEYQDTNAAQLKLLQYLTQFRQNICVVGDDDQSIYAWRGADVGNILNFPTYFPGAKEIKLEQNYRSTNNILRAANSVIAHNGARFDKNLWSTKGDGEEIKLAQLEDGDAEADFVLNMMNHIISANPDCCYRDFAVLYRSNYLSRVLEQTFNAHGIRPRIIGGQEFFQRKEVKDAVAYLKLVLNKRDDQSLLRVIGVPPRGIGDKAIMRLRDLRKAASSPMQELLTESAFSDSVTKAAANSAANLAAAVQKARDAFSSPGGLADKVTEYLEDVGYLNGFLKIYRDAKEAEDRRDNVLEFINSISQIEYNAPPGSDPLTLGDLLERFSLLDDSDRTKNDDDDNRNVPVFSTVHAAKGLEFPIVFVIGMEEGLFPHERAMEESSRGVEEERRLCYVAITRAREQLILTLARKRFKYGEFEMHKPSRFLQDLPDELASRLQSQDDLIPRMSEDEQRAAFEAVLEDLRRKMKEKGFFRRGGGDF